MKIVIPAYERDNYRDLSLLLKSIEVYGDPTMKTTVYYKGNSPSLVGIRAMGTNFIKQDWENKHFGHACAQMIKEEADEVLLIVNDDTVFTPDTIKDLQEDLQVIEGDDPNWGLVGLRSNYSAGAQNIRTPIGKLEGIKYDTENSILRVDTVFGVAFLLRKKVTEFITDDWTKIQWYGDNLLSYDAKMKGFTAYVSRSYIHHHGSQSGKDYPKYDKEGREWLRENRPDFYIKLI